MSVLYNPTPLPMTGMYAGLSFQFPPGKKVVIKTHRKRGEIISGEEIAQKLHDDLRQLGLQLLNEEDPQSKEQMDEAGFKALRIFIRAQIKHHNDLNLDLAAEGKATKRVTEDLKKLQKILKEIGDDDDEEGFIGKAELRTVASRGAQNAQALNEQVKQMLLSGDNDGALALIQGKGTNPTTPGEAAEDSQKANDETEFLDVKPSPGHGPGRMPKSVAAARSKARGGG